MHIGDGFVLAEQCLFQNSSLNAEAFSEQKQNKMLQ